MSEESRAALVELEVRLGREVADLRQILASDLPAHLRRAARAAFERSAGADAMSDAALAALKQASEAAAADWPSELLAPFAELSAWTWPAEQPFPAEPSGLRDHPGLGAMLAELDARLRALLSEHALDPRDLGPEQGAYREPAYFVGGLYLKSVVANFWRALADHHALRRELGEQAGAEQRAARRRRWEDA